MDCDVVPVFVVSRTFRYTVKIVGDHYEKVPVPEDNWVWSKIGVIDMHNPDRWGMLQVPYHGSSSFLLHHPPPPPPPPGTHVLDVGRPAAGLPACDIRRFLIRSFEKLSFSPRVCLYWPDWSVLIRI